MNAFSFLFTNLKTGETREVMMELRSFFCRLDGCTVYQLFINNEPAAETAFTPDAAIENGAWITEPETTWGWPVGHIKRELPRKARVEMMEAA